MLIAIAVGAVLRVRGAAIGGDLADVSAYRHHIFVALERGENVYLSDQRYPYFPGWLGVEIATWYLSQSLKQSFWWTIRLAIVAADVAACFALWWATARWQGETRARWATALYAMSPIAILIGGYHGQFEPFPTFFSLIAAGLAVGGAPAWKRGGALGIALALKPYPALLVPLLMRDRALTWRGRATLALLAGGIAALATAPLLFPEPLAVYRNVFGYPGLNDQGLGGLLRSIWMPIGQNMHLPGAFGLELSSSTRWLSLALMAFTFVVTFHEPLPRAAAAVFLAFLATFGGVSTQYLIWPLAWLLMSSVPLGWSVVYSLAASAGAIGFYLVYWPQLIVPGDLRPPAPQFIPHYIAGQAIAFVAFWVVYLVTIRPALRARWRHPLVLGMLLLTIGAAVPVVGQVSYLVGEMTRRV